MQRKVEGIFEGFEDVHALRSRFKKLWVPDVMQSFGLDDELQIEQFLRLTEAAATVIATAVFFKVELGDLPTEEV